MQDLLAGKTAIVTGSTSGIGEAIAEAFAAQGAWVAIIGTNAERGEQVVKKIKESTHSDRAAFYSVDVSNTTAVEQIVKDIAALKGGIDILVNNAGITKDGLLMRMSENDWDAVIQTNLKSCFNWAKPVSRLMLKAKKGKIINVSSVVGLAGEAGQVNYASSKAGMIGFTKSLAKEIASRNIQVNCIAPGFIETRMTAVLPSERKEEVLKMIPLARMGTPAEVANAALFLASPLSDYITGQVLTVDGGMVM
jgi:3-oxoacyl-[acyl-carrier protein] reductase